MKEDAWNWITENEKMIIEASGQIWNFAELGLVEVKSARFLSEILKNYGFVVERGVADMQRK